MRLRDTRIYTTSIELNKVCGGVVERLPPGYGWLADQIRRAASSVTLNFAEGFRRTGARDRRHFFTIAAASASEVGAAVDIAHAYRAATDEDRLGIEKLTNHLSAMLRLFR